MRDFFFPSFLQASAPILLPTAAAAAVCRHLCYSQLALAALTKIVTFTQLTFFILNRLG